MLQTRNLTITMKKDLRDLLRDFTFSLNPGDKAAIIGEEGNGKSTPAKAALRPRPGGALCGVQRDHPAGRHAAGVSVPGAAAPAGRPDRL